MGGECGVVFTVAVGLGGGLRVLLLGLGVVQSRRSWPGQFVAVAVAVVAVAADTGWQRNSAVNVERSFPSRHLNDFRFRLSERW